MNTKKYLQTDSRWSQLGYPKHPCTIGVSGCGEVSIANIIIEMKQYENYTPATIQPYCKQFAEARCNGTYIAQIPTMMKHYGLTEVKEHATMDSLWKELAKGDRVAIYLMGNRPGGKNKVHWTSSAHFVCSVDYKYKENKHWVYVKDSASDSKLRNGWITFEDNMQHDVSQCWSGKLNGAKPSPTPTPTPTGKLVVDGIGGTATVMRMQEFFKTTQDGVIGGQLVKFKTLYPSLTAVSFGKGGSRCIYKLQEWLGLSNPDGIIGKNTTSAWQKKLKALGYLPKNEGIDGIFGVKSMKAWQECLNNNGKKKGGSPDPKPDPPKKSTKIIDVSEFQSDIDWAKVKADGIKGAIVRCGYRGASTGKLNEDAMFLKHIKGASKVGLNVGIYMFTEAINEKEAKAEADYAIKMWQKANVPISYPIAVDTEPVNIKDERARNLTKAQRTNVIKAFCQQIKAKGYTPMIYASTSWLNNKLDMSKLPYDVWVAQYHTKCEYKGKYIIWQYTSEGKVDGIKGKVDLNHCYITPKKVNPPTPKPSGKGYPGAYPNVDRSKMLVDKAVELAWKKGTNSSTYKYPSGKPTDAFKKALDKFYPEHTKWGKAPSVGASCDVFVGTCVRACGIDSKFPRGLQEQEKHKPSMFYRAEYSDVKPIDKSKDGDIVMFNYSGGAHIIIRGNGYYYEANYENYFGHTNVSLDRLKKKYYKVIILRPKNFLDKGDYGQEVTKLQEYLNWYTDGKFFKECGKADGVYGNNTLKYVVKMQTDFFGAKEADGTVGVKTIEAMKKVKK